MLVGPGPDGPGGGFTSRSPVQDPLAVGSRSQVEPRIVGSSVVVSAERESVVEIGAAALAPAQLMVVDLAPGEGAGAAGHGTGVVEEGEGTALGRTVEPAGPSEVEGQRVAVEDRGDEARAAGEPSRLSCGDRDAAV